MSEYRSNSHRSKENELHDPLPERRAEKVVSGAVKQKKKTGLNKFTSLFMPGDVDSVRSYIFMDVLVPSIKRAISDIVCNGINMLLGEPGRKRENGAPAAKVSYRKYYDEPAERPRARSASFSYDDIIFDDRGDVEMVLERMEELVDRFGTVSVADMYDLAGLSCEWTANKYGWTDLRGTSIRRVSNGYIIDLPRPVAL